MSRISNEIITPAIAKQLLERNGRNRKLRTDVVARYAADMRSGNWTECTQTISIYDDGELADGAHRLNAVIKSGRSIMFTVRRGISRAAGLNIDTGLGRSVIDAMRIGGGVCYTKTVIATARAIEFGGPYTNRGLSNSELMEITERWLDASMFADQHVRKIKHLGSTPVLAAVAQARMHEGDEARLARFCAVLATGLYDNPGESAAAVLRNYLISRGGRASWKAEWRSTFLRAQNAIHHFMRGRPLAILKGVGDEIYPKIARPAQQLA